MTHLTQARKESKEIYRQLDQGHLVNSTIEKIQDVFMKEWTVTINRTISTDQEEERGLIVPEDMDEVAIMVTNTMEIDLTLKVEEVDMMGDIHEAMVMIGTNRVIEHHLEVIQVLVAEGIIEAMVQGLKTGSLDHLNPVTEDITMNLDEEDIEEEEDMKQGLENFMESTEMRTIYREVIQVLLIIPNGMVKNIVAGMIILTMLCSNEEMIECLILHWLIGDSIWPMLQLKKDTVVEMIIVEMSSCKIVIFVKSGIKIMVMINMAIKMI